MKVMRFNDSTTDPGFIVDTVPVPQPGKGELLIRVHAAGVTPTELGWYPTSHTQSGGTRTGAILGHEFSGVVELVGEGGDMGQVGRAVFGMNDWYADGATAEYCVAPATGVAEKLARLSFAEAATVPIGALTAWQGLLDRAKLEAGERVLIHGGAGAVGVFAIQLARGAGAHVITTASLRNFELLKDLGANEVIDYRSRPFEESARDLDVVFDAVGGETLKRSWSLLKPNGRVVTIAADSEGIRDERTTKAFFIVAPNGAQLGQIASLLDAGELRCVVDTVVPLAMAGEAYLGKLKERRGRGKVVVAVREGAGA
jgi:NADPH:quinone reductase-like Zn-dependent oxidoreductase